MLRNLVYIAASSLLALAIVACGGDSDAEGSPLDLGDNGEEPTSSPATATAPADAAPEATEAPANGDTGGEGTYTVQPGDTLAAIAQQFGVTVQEIVDANDIANPDVISPGQILEIP